MGYYYGKEVKACLEAGITTLDVVPTGRNMVIRFSINMVAAFEIERILLIFIYCENIDVQYGMSKLLNALPLEGLH